MKRVKSFECLNHTVNVEYLEDVWFDGAKVFGSCDPYRGKIQVATREPGSQEELSEEVIQHSYEHEKAHYLMFFVDDNFYKNEKKIDLLGALSAQYEKTRKYEDVP
jgi:hypothetical protein